MQTFLKAYYFHSIGELEKAITFYTESLKQGGNFTYNYLRLETLQRIEQILDKKKN